MQHLTQFLPRKQPANNKHVIGHDTPGHEPGAPSFAFFWRRVGDYEPPTLPEGEHEDSPGFGVPTDRSSSVG